MRIQVVDYGRTFATRPSADALRKDVDELLTAKPAALIELDFSGVSKVSFSFVDELFGVLFTAHREEKAAPNIRVRNAPPVLARALDMSISSRGLDHMANRKRMLA